MNVDLSNPLIRDFIKELLVLVIVSLRVFNQRLGTSTVFRYRYSEGRPHSYFPKFVKIIKDSQSNPELHVFQKNC